MNEKETQGQKDYTEPQGYYRHDVGKGVFLFLSRNEKHEAQERQGETYWENKVGRWMNRRSNWLRRHSAVIIMIATLVNLGVAYLQWSTMIEETAANKRSAQAAEGQLTEMRSGSVDTRTVAEATQKNVATAQAALKATLDNSRLDQRAWVGVKELHLTEALTANKHIEFVVEVQNMGKTPGLNVTTRTQFSMDPPIDLKSIDLLGVDLGNRVVPPGTESYPSIVVFPGDRVLTEEEVAVLKKRKTPLYLFGLITYEDIFGEFHRTRFCGVYRHNDTFPTALNWCEQKDYNAMQ